MIDTRCGLKCEGCEFVESCNCEGCIATNGHPFHGECPVAMCRQKEIICIAANALRFPVSCCSSIPVIPNTGTIPRAQE